MAATRTEFDISKYQIQPTVQKVKVQIEATGDEFEVSIKPMSWSKRNQLISQCLNWQQSGETSFDGGAYVRECLKEIIVEASWGKTTEAFLATIDERLGTALESLVPSAFGADALTPDTVKKE